MPFPSLRQLGVAGALLVVVNILVWLNVSRLGDGKLHVYFLDVGQGDSALIVSPSGKQILIDGGPNLAALQELGRHQPFMDRHIELLILSHPDKDHVTALPELLRRYSIERMILTGVEHDLGQYQDLIEEIDAQNIEVLWPDPKMDIDMGDGLVLDILWPDSNALDPELETNDTSIVFKAIFKEHSILFTGDINDDIEQRIMSMGEDVRSDILKVAHHGSKTSSSTGFLLEVDPDLAVISVGKDNSYGHPHPLITKRFHQLGIETKTTADLGTISLEFE